MDTDLARLRQGFERWVRRSPIASDGVTRIGARQIYILPTRIGLIFGAVLLTMLLGSLNYQNNLGLMFTFFLASVVVIAMHHAWFNLLGLKVQARGGMPVFVNERACFEVNLYGDDARRARHDLRVRMIDGASSASVSVPAGDRQTLTLSRIATRRGWLRLDAVRIETCHPLHLFRAWCYAATRASTLIYPAPATRAPSPQSTAGNLALLHHNGADGREDYAGSRDYQRGDALSHIDWKAFARERGLIVKQFDGDQGQDVLIDWGQFGGIDQETRLSLLTRQVLDASAAQVRFELRLPGVEEPPARGQSQTQRCLTHLALFGRSTASED